MSYNDYTDRLRFPNGRPVHQCKKDAKKLSKECSQKYQKCLDQKAVEYSDGKYKNWDQAIKDLVWQAVADARRAPDQISLQQLIELEEKHPKITQYGIGMSPLSLCQQSIIDPDADLDDDEYYNNLVATEHKGIFCSSSMPWINLAIQFIKQLSPSCKPNKKKNRNSYELKHLAEHWLQTKHTDGYLPHGCFIIAALHQGYLPQRCSRNSVSLYFNFDEKSLRQIDKYLKEEYLNKSGAVQ